MSQKGLHLTSVVGINKILVKVRQQPKGCRVKEDGGER